MRDPKFHDLDYGFADLPAARPTPLQTYHTAEQIEIRSRYVAADRDAVGRLVTNQRSAKSARRRRRYGRRFDATAPVE